MVEKKRFFGPKQQSQDQKKSKLGNSLEKLGLVSIKDILLNQSAQKAKVKPKFRKIVLSMRSVDSRLNDIKTK